MMLADRQFGKDLDRRLAQLRQDSDLTQHEVAAHLRIAQQTLAQHEIGRLRRPVALVPKLAALFGVPTEVLLEVTSPGECRGKRGSTPTLEHLSRRPKAQQQVVLAMLDGVLLQHGLRPEAKAGQRSPRALRARLAIEQHRWTEYPTKHLLLRLSLAV